MNSFKCDKCKDSYYIVEPARPGRMRIVSRCNCPGANKYFFTEWLGENKKYIHTTIQNGDITVKELIKLLSNE